MTLGFIGLGRMGENMVRNLLDHKVKPVVFDLSNKQVAKLSRAGAASSLSLPDMVKKVGKKGVYWLMVPAGKPVDMILDILIPHLSRGAIVIDGGNSFYQDSQKRYKKLKKKGIKYVDVGTSGGISGARRGACMMIGGDKTAFKKTEKLYKAMCVKDGYGYMGNSGAGHFVKMVHNGIEYGMMGAINEGLEAIKKHKKTFGTDLHEAVKVYAHGSIISSSLLTWLHEAFDEKGYLKAISCKVPKGETEEEMKKLEKLAPMPVLHQARLMRAQSREGKWCATYVAAMRNKFGGHKVNKK